MSNDGDNNRERRYSEKLSEIDSEIDEAVKESDFDRYMELMGKRKAVIQSYHSP